MRFPRVLALAVTCAGLLAARTAMAAPGSPAGSLPDSAAAAALFARAERFFRAGASDSTLQLVGPLAARAAAAGQERLELNARLHEASALCAVGRPRDGEAAGRRALALARSVGDSARARMAMRWVSFALLGQGRATDAAAGYGALARSAVAAGDPREEAYARMGLAYLALNRGEAAAAVAGYTRAVSLFARTGEPVMELESLVGLARARNRQGRYAEMRRIYDEILRKAAGAGARRAAAFARNNLAVYESEVGDPGRAVQLWEQALHDLESAGDLQGSVTPGLNLAAARMELGDFDGAEAVLAELGARCEREGYGSLHVEVLSQLGTSLAAHGRFDEAAATFRRAAAVAEAPLEARLDAVAQLARTLARVGRHDEALASLDAWGATARAAVSPTLRADLDLMRAENLMAMLRHREALAPLGRAAATARDGGFRLALMRALVLRARCDAALGVPDSAIVRLREAQQVWEDLRAVPRSPVWREQRGALGGEIAGELTRLLLRHPAATPAPARVSAAFDLLQRFKSRTLLERMLGPDAFAAGLAGERAPVTLAQLQAGVLRDGDLLLDYALDDTASLLFAVARDTCAVYELPSRQALAARASLYLQMITARRANDDTAPVAGERAAARLARDLIGPASDLVARAGRVVFAPDGALNRLPLERLLRQTTAANRARDGDGPDAFRIPSATVLAALREEMGRAMEAERGVTTLAAVAGPDSLRLPGAVAEARWLARRFRGVAAAATVCAVPGDTSLPALPDGREILHVAAHTEAFDQRPWNSRILLGADAAGRPCWLAAADIATGRIGARLAVISGCETGGGRVVSGEGVLGLTGAFLSAGASAVVVSLWPVDDVATLRLMRRFYRELAAGRTVAQALAQARDALGRDGETAAAVHRDAFVVVGDGDITVALARRTPAILVVPAALAVLALLSLPVGRARRRARRDDFGPAV